MMRVRLDGLTREWWLLGLVATALALLIVIGEGTRRFDTMLYDGLVRLDRHRPGSDILLVAIDNSSLETVGRWPWPREVHAQLIDAVARAHPKAVAYDVLFLEPAPGDAALGRAIASGPVFLPLLLARPGSDGRRFDLKRPPAVLRQAAAGMGHVGIAPDSDGVVRHMRLWDGDARQALPHLMLNLDRTIVRVDSRDAMPRHRAPLLLPLMPTGSYPTISAAAVLRGQVPPEVFRNRIVLVGATAPGLGDWHAAATPDGVGGMAGVELQANLLDALRENRMIDEAGPGPITAVTLIALWALLLALRALSPNCALLALLAIVLGVLGLSMAVLHAWHIWLPPGAALLMLFVVYPVWGWRRLVVMSRFVTDELERLQRAPGSIQPVPQGGLSVDPVTRQSLLLRNAITTLRTAQRQREELVQFLSHDMRSPQASIIAVLENAGAGDMSSELAARIEAYARRTLALADGFVQLARAEVQSYRMEQVNLSDIVLEALDDVWPLVRQNGLTASIVGEDECLVVTGDRVLLSRVFINLLGNAVNHSPRGGRIEVALSRSIRDAKPTATCTITDQGPGVAEEQRPRLFERFGVNAMGPKGAPPSAGLGLSFVHTVILRHGGTVWYEDARAGGARFGIGLDLAPRARGKSPAGRWPISGARRRLFNDTGAQS